MERELVPEQSVPVAHDVDVLVAGGGPAGFAAALASAREGARTLLVERYGYLGGMVTGSHVVWVLGMGDGERPKAKGICKDIRDRLEPLGAISRSNKCGDYAVDPEVFKWQAVEMLEEAGAEVLLHTMACDPLITDGRVRGILTESKTGRQAIRAKVTIDCTADADLAHRAGCASENETHDVTLIVRVTGVDREQVAEFQREHPAEHDTIVEAAKQLNGGVLPDKGRHVKGIDVTDAAALSEAEKQLRREYFAALYHLREHLPGWQNAQIRETLPQIGVRQSRRVRGGYTLADADLRASRKFDDGIARLGSFLLVYKNYDPAGLDYDIPYRSLVPADADGLLVAGRCISADYLAANTLRLIVPCIASGQAAGVAAALAVKAGVQPREVDVAALQGALLAQGAYLGGDEAAASGPALQFSEEV